MVREVFDLQSAIGFLPPRSSNPGWQHPPQVGNNVTHTQLPTTSLPCGSSPSVDPFFNFSTDLLCELLREYREPNILDPRTKAIVIAGYATLITIGIVSNLLVCCVVLRQTTHNSSHMQGKSRNLYILNLAVADLALCCICMPLTLHSLLNFNWTLGLLLCKLAPLIQATNMLVSAGTITAIAIDRYDTIVRSSRKRKHSFADGRNVASGIAIIWLLSLLLNSPLFFYTQVETVSIHGIFLYDKCVEQWPSDTLKIAFSFGLTVVQFVIPVCTLSTIHIKISSFLMLHLRPGQRPGPKIEIHSPIDHLTEGNLRIPTDDDTLNAEKCSLQKEYLNIKRKESICSENSQRSESSRKNSDCSESKRLSTPDISPRKNSNFLTSLRENSDFSFSFSKLSRESSRKSPKNIRRELRRNRRTTLLLSCIACVYAISWLPYNVYNIATNIHTFGLSPTILYKAFIAAHMMAMTSVCVNPFLYGWLNTNFRREFRQIFSTFADKCKQLSCRRFHMSSSSCFSKLFKKSSKIINSSTYNDAAMKGLEKKTALSFIPRSRQGSVMVAIYSDSLRPPL